MLSINFGEVWDVWLVWFIVILFYCNFSGNWNWYEFWISCEIGNIFGFGFVFDFF